MAPPSRRASARPAYTSSRSRSRYNYRWGFSGSGRRARAISSRVTAAILLSLLDGPRTSRELADETGLRPKDVAAYLSYYRRKGWVELDPPFWRLTDLGAREVRRISRLLEHLVYGKSLINNDNTHGIIHRLNLTKDDKRIVTKETTKEEAKECVEPVSGSSSHDGRMGDLERRPSPETAYLLLLLYREGPMDYAELSWRLGVDRRRVRDRIRYLARKGWVRRNSPFVSLTDYGRERVERYSFYLERVAAEKYSIGVDSQYKRVSRTSFAESRGKRRTKAEQGGIRRTKVGESGGGESGAPTPGGRMAEEIFENMVKPCAESFLGRSLEREERDLLLLLTGVYVARPHNPYLKLDTETLFERFGAAEPYERALRELVAAGIVYRSKRGPFYRLDRACTPRL